MSLATGSSSIVVDKVNINGIGFAGGLQAGYNWQFAERLVVGVEGDINHLGLKRSYRESRADRPLLKSTTAASAPCAAALAMPQDRR